MLTVSRNDVCESVVESLDFNSSIYKIFNDEIIASLIRRIASNICPASKSQIYRLLIQSISPLIDNIDDEKRERFEQILDDLIAYGDLIQSEAVISLEVDSFANSLYAAPPSFVCWGSGKIMLIGLTPDNFECVDSSLINSIEYKRHTRWLNVDNITDTKNILLSNGLFELDINTWLGSPKEEDPNKFIKRINRKLDNSELSGDLNELTIVDSSMPVKYYKGRWKEVKNQSGKFICRWNQYVGANKWGYVELINGKPKKLLVLPFENKEYRACDEAWRIQAAIDYLHNHPQIYKVRDNSIESGKIIDFFSPIPFWAKRRLDVVGQPIDKSKCLFSYNLSNDFDKEFSFIENMLWLKKLNSDSN